MALIRPESGWGALIERCAREVLARAQLICATEPNRLSFSDIASCRFTTDDIPRALPSLGQYLDLVVKWNQRHDLTAARDSAELVDLFVADAVMLAAATTTLQDWIDIGTGAGAPGLPLRLLQAVSGLTLVEPRTKRTAFLKSVVGTLDLADVEVLRARSEAVAARSHEVSVSRATFAPEIWLPEGARLATQAVWVLLAKGELPVLPGWQAELDVRYVWPLTDVPRRAVRLVPVRR